MKKLMLFALLTAFIAGCYYDNEEYLYPKLDLNCDTTGVTFSKSILPILHTNCLGCHDAADYASMGGNINLEDFTILKQLVDGGNFYGAVTHSPLRSWMPKNGAKLDTCSITKIKIWIDKGALNN